MKLNGKRFLSMILAMAMVLSLIPAMSMTALAADTVTTVSPVGTTIDLFDYSVEKDVNIEVGQLLAPDKGINAKHALKFRSTNKDNPFGTVNKWTGSANGALQGIVKSQLGDDGYPKLSGDQVIFGSVGGNNLDTTESLAYLFDPNVAVKSADGTTSYKRSYANVSGLLQVDQNGYFYYNSSDNYAEFDTKTNSFKVYNNWAVKFGTANNGQFFPFNTYDSLGDTPQTILADNDNLNHYFGVHMSTQFAQKNGGYTEKDGNVPVTYEFSGDDDVWVFVDGVLVADLGGIHDKADLTINFAEGKVEISKVFISEGKYETNKITYFNAIDGLNIPEEQNTFADDTYHTLDFFYLERGGNASNMKLKFNLEEIPPSYIVKVDQDGRALSNVNFNLIVDGVENRNDADKTPVTVANDTTNENGELLLYYGEGMGDKRGHLLSLQDLYKTYESRVQGTNTTAPYIALTLKEQSTPAGYRTVGDIHLRLQKMGDNYILLSNDIWTTGAYAMSTVTAKAPQVITLNSPIGNETSRDLLKVKDSGGTMFAIVLKWNGKEDPNENTIRDVSNWVAVHGNDTTGWIVEDEDFAGVKEATEGEKNKVFREALVKTVQEILKEENSELYTFKLSPDGSWKTNIEELPGDITSYFYMQDSAGVNETKYTIAYYYTDDLKNMTADNTRWVNSEKFERNFAVKVQVPNIKNYLVVQRLDQNGNPVEDAEFTLYEDDKKAVVDTDTTIDRVKDVPPAEGENPSRFTMKGAAYFSGLSEGTYYLKETKAPDGYTRNEEIVKVIVNDDGVFAYAGDAGENESNEIITDETKGVPYGDNDGISVLVGVGSLVESLAQFGSTGEVDNTLSDIYVQRRTTDNEPTKETVWNDVQIDGADEKVFLTYDPEAALEYKYAGPKTDIDTPYGFLSSSGWNWHKITQNYGYNGSEDTPRANKTDLSDMNLTPLFSGTTTVRFASAAVGDLTISKTVEDPIQTAADDDTDEKFTFALSLEYAEPEVTGENAGDIDLSVDLAGSYNYKVVNDTAEKESGTVSIEKNADGNYYISSVSDNNSAYFTQSGDTYTLKLGDKDTLTIQGLPVGTSYTVKENPAAGYQTTSTVQVYGGATDGTASEGDSGKISAAGEKHIVCFTNSVIPRAKYTVKHFKWDTETKEYVEQINDTQTLSGNVGETVNATAKNYPGYTLNTQAEGAVPSGIVAEDDSLVLKLYYDIDKIGGTDPDNPGDGIPDKYQVTVNYVASNNGKIADGAKTTEVLTIKDADGKFATTGAVTATGSTAIPNSGYKFSKWTESKNGNTATDTELQAATGKIELNGVQGGDVYTYTASFEAQPYIPPVDPTPPPEDLNTDDHVAYIIGYPDGTVQPGGNITRAEVATIFFRLLTDEARNLYWSQTNDYIDVPADAWYNNAISTLSNMGILEGDGDDTFRPDDYITRAEFTKIAVSFFKNVDDYDYENTFTDVDPDKWYAKYIAAAKAMNLIQGDGDDTFRPDDYITRAEACTIVNRTLGRKPHENHLLDEDEMITWPDNPKSEWYYAQIQEATNSHDFKLVTEGAEEVEQWTEKLKERDWVALEKIWSEANSAPGGEVM